MTVSKQMTESEVSYPFMVAVKFRNSSRPYTFGTTMDTLRQGDQVVVETSQGIEMGVCQAAPLNTEKFPPSMPLKPVLRIADEQDLRDYEANCRFAEQAFAICEEEIKSLGLEMNMQSADYMLDRSKILFIYIAEQRVDFRELLKRLNYRLHCKIELRQIGERDKAKMIGGVGMCGMECCCSRFKNHFDVISINMAKTQLLALNIDKLSGVCGKLMCCLKYENDSYKEMTDGLPKMGAHVEYEGEMYKVASMNVMTNEARIENNDTYQMLSLDELKEKAIVRKGVALAKKGTRPRQARPQQNSVPRVKPADPMQIDLVDLEKENLPSDLSFAAKPAFRARFADGDRKIETRRIEAGQKESRRQNQNRNDGSKVRKPKAGNPRNVQRQARSSLKESARNNPNVTVRSFKSSRTKAAEKKGDTE